MALQTQHLQIKKLRNAQITFPNLEQLQTQMENTNIIIHGLLNLRFPHIGVHTLEVLFTSRQYKACRKTLKKISSGLEESIGLLEQVNTFRQPVH